jgi:hypothetical protein
MFVGIWLNGFPIEMFRLLFNAGKSGTCRPVKHAPGSKQQQFSDITLRTLGTGDLIGTTPRVTIPLMN